MKLKKTLTVIFAVALAVTVLSVSVSAYYFFAGEAIIDAELKTEGPAVAIVSTSSNLSNITITISGKYLTSEGVVKTLEPVTKTGSGNSLSLSVDIPTDGVRWVDEVKAEFSATCNGVTGSTSITKIIH